MEIVRSDLIGADEPLATQGSSIDELLEIVAGVRWAAEAQTYVQGEADFLLPFTFLRTPPPGAGADVPPESQDDKFDFGKQNVREFHLGDTSLVRGWIRLLPADPDGEEEFFPFLKISYRGGPDSALSQATRHSLQREITLHLGLFQRSAKFMVAYNEESHRYDVELWGCSAREADGRVGPRAKAAIEAGSIQFTPQLIRGEYDDFRRDQIEGASVWDLNEENLIHPLRPLRVLASWSDRAETTFDPASGGSRSFVFNSLVRGWSAFEAAGQSADTHGGTGNLRYTNLISNYARDRKSLGRALEPWMFNAFGTKDGNREEAFFAVDYVDLHLLEAGASIGIHRHRDNQEIIFVHSGWGYLVSGDWCQFPGRDRSFQVQILKAGQLATVRSGGLHGFKNVSDERVQLLMLGGYD